MDATIVELRPIVAIVAGVGMGVYALRFGWLILFRSRAPLSPMHKAALWVLRATQGDEARSARQIEFADPRRRRGEAISFLFVGFMLILYGLGYMAGILLGLVPLVHGAP